jgi:hypothetical protein
MVEVISLHQERRPKSGELLKIRRVSREVMIFSFNRTETIKLLVGDKLVLDPRNNDVRSTLYNPELVEYFGKIDGKYKVKILGHYDNNWRFLNDFVGCTMSVSSLA